MKKYLTLIALCITVVLSFAQNPVLPSEPCLIVLKNNKLIKDARLWEVYINRVEYQKEGSLHDLLIEKIERIETDNEIITFEPGGKMFKQQYDLIILHSGSTLMQGKESDTIKCRITKVTGANIYYYRQKKRQREMYVSLSIVKRYIWNGVEKIPGEKEHSEEKISFDRFADEINSQEGRNDKSASKDSSDLTDFSKMSEKELYIKGYNDAAMYYKDHGTTLVTFSSTLASPIAGCLITGLLGAVPPKPKAKNVPDIGGLNYPSYVKGYKNKARGIRARKAVLGFGISAGIYLVVLSALYAGGF